MKMNINFLLSVAISLFLISKLALADPLTDAYASSTDEEKLVFCAPILTKEGGVYQFLASKFEENGESDKAKIARKAAFDVGYRGQTLQWMGESNNPVLLDKLWDLSGKYQTKESYRTLRRSCLAFYNVQSKAGNISVDIEQRAIDKIHQEINEQESKFSIKPECRSNKPPYTDLCKISRSIADELAEQLPMRLNKNLSLESVLANGKRINMYTLLAYDRKTLESIANENGVPLNSIRSAMIVSAKNGVCSGNEAKTFIELGGSIQYLYRFVDGTTYMNIDVSNCL